MVSCKSKEAINSNNNEGKDSTIGSTTMKIATIVDYSTKSESCGFLIKLANEELLQALELPKEFMQDGKEILIDYTLSRRQQGPCSYGSPIIINEIKSRK